MNDTWGYMRDDNNWKSTATLLRNLIDIASKGGNYLLNVGPTSEGLIPQPSIERLAEIGAWMKVNGEAIYGTSPTPFGAEVGAYSDTEKDRNGQWRFIPAWDWHCTTKPAKSFLGFRTAPAKIYLEIFNWPADGKIELAGLQNKVKAAYLLSNRKELPVEQSASGVIVKLPATAPDKIVSVVCLNIKGRKAEVAGGLSGPPQ